ncbi:hypothetical protein CAOG_04244 [Capsaspora owczarzaki ATCC 30864]|uniref:Uncharacterized protein n=1 Tax=Capsaspora owczarzaki (strain ATCC 30864) TaxID=595528 RepID=A0A0D2UEA3_CAPO3|nr:hypothetical protein CAOG_04244 [Capsaspora owczarzaki ATCC 30864]KJE93456.1 hypothetical protein CAOG_004244 [Capsaspora owczarzaki ATCC 30864]|eukprot:XP_004348069.2 hypothetical protein CAOG_04244 [Capsaspora owczarzaki ATCC 30864]
MLKQTGLQAAGPSASSPLAGVTGVDTAVDEHLSLATAQSRIGYRQQDGQGAAAGPPSAVPSAALSSSSRSASLEEPTLDMSAAMMSAVAGMVAMPISTQTLEPTSPPLSPPPLAAQPALASGSSSEHPSIHGWLNKLGAKGLVKTWKTRWMVFQPFSCQLHYYESPKDVYPLGTIDISNATFTIDNDANKHSDSGHFSINTEARRYILAARDKETMLGWLGSLQEERQRYQARIQSNTNTTATTPPAPVSAAASLAPTQAAVSPEPALAPSGTALPPSTATTAPPARPSLGTVSPSGSPASERRGPPPRPLPYAVYLENSIAAAAETGSSASSSTEAPPQVTTAQPTPSAPGSGADATSTAAPVALEPAPSAPPSVSTASTSSSNRWFSSLKLKTALGGSGSATGSGSGFGSGAGSGSGSGVGSASSSPGNVSHPATPGSAQRKASDTTDSKPFQRFGFSIKLGKSTDSATIESLRDELAQAEKDISVREEVLQSLYQSIKELDAERQSRAALDRCASDKEKEELLVVRDRRVMELESNIHEMSNERDTARAEADAARARIAALEEQLLAISDTLVERDREIVSLSDKTIDRHQFQTAQAEIRKLREENTALAERNSFLTSENNAVIQFRTDNDRTIARQQKKIAQLEGDLSRARSSYYALLQRLPASQAGTASSGLGSEGGGGIADLDPTLPAFAEPSDAPNDAALDSLGQYDQYGFLEPSSSDALGSLIKHSKKQVATQSESLQETRLQRWNRYMQTHSGKPIDPNAKELKSLVRSGIPEEFRTEIWLECIERLTGDDRRMMGAGHYFKLLESNVRKQSRATQQIELDLLRTLPLNVNYSTPTAPGIANLRRVLVAYSWHNPQVGYCQGMNLIAAILLLHLNEEDSFWGLVALIEHVMPPDYYNASLIASQADQRVLRDLLQEKCPRLFAHLDKLKIDLTMITFNWFLTLFVDALSPEVLFRVWDTFFLEGNKVLFRYALGLLRVNEKTLLAMDDSLAIFNYLKNLSTKSFDPDVLWKASFPDLNPFPKSKIAQRRQHHLTMVKNEVNDLERNRADYIRRKARAEIEAQERLRTQRLHEEEQEMLNSQQQQFQHNAAILEQETTATTTAAAAATAATVTSSPERASFTTSIAGATSPPLPSSPTALRTTMPFLTSPLKTAPTLAVTQSDGSSIAQPTPALLDGAEHDQTLRDELAHATSTALLTSQFGLE